MHYEFTRKIVVNTLYIHMHAWGALNETNLHIYVYMLFARREVRIGKNCALRLEYSRKRAQFFPIRTDPRLVNNILHFTT